MIPFLLWNRIIGSSLRERIAAADALKRQPAALDRAVFLDGLDRVLRAGRDIPAAGRFVWRNIPAIKPDHRQQQPLHVRAAATLLSFKARSRAIFGFLIACAYGPYPCDQHKVDAVGKFVLVETVRLTEQTLDAVSFHRTRQLGTDGESPAGCSRACSCGSRSQRVFLPWTHHDDTIGGIRGFPLRILFFSSSDAPVFS